MIVKIVAYGRFSSVGSGGHPSVARARAVKYMANRPAKNISSLESQMIVPAHLPEGSGPVGYVDPVEAVAAEVHQRSEEHTSELQSRQYLVCRLLLEKKTCALNTL